MNYLGVGADPRTRSPLPGVQAELGEEGVPHYRLHRELIRVRRARPFLATGRIRVCHLASQQLAYEITGGPGEVVVTALNLADQPVALELPDCPAGALGVVAGHQAPARTRPTRPRAAPPPPPRTPPRA